MQGEIQFRPTPSKSDPSDRPHIGWLALVTGLTAVVLVITADDQIFDTNFYTLWEATALLAGDHPYRDFYEWGVPLQAAVSAGAQLLAGYRLIGEFLVQWLFIVAGVVLSFHVGLRLSHSIAASFVTLPFTLAILAATPTFHYPKLFFYPLAIWLAWFYMDRPSAGRSAVLGLTTAVVFLFRHDHGVYVGGASLLAHALARVAVPASRSVRSLIQQGAAYIVAVAAVLAPWMIVVHRSEGLGDYVRSRADLYDKWSAGSPYQWLRGNPARVLAAELLPPAETATVSFAWLDSADQAMRDQLERSHGLLRREGPDARERWHYEVANVFDASLLELSPYIRDTEGFDWNLLRTSRSWLPARDNAQTWLYQLSVLVPMLALVAAGLDLRRRWRRAESVPFDTYRLILAAVFLAAIESRLFREPSYFVVVAPLTAALSARLLAGRGRDTRAVNLSDRRFRLERLRPVMRWAFALSIVLVTSITTFAYARRTGIFEPLALIESVGPAFEELLASPPIDGYFPPEVVRRYDGATWQNLDADEKARLRIRYVHDCTRPGDRVLVTGSTPYHVAYYDDRPIAGGHLFWHHGWRSDPAHEMQSLALLKSQSVPFAFSTSDPVLEDFKRYPTIHEYLLKHYVEPHGASGLLLVDTRRQSTGPFEPMGWPCFR